MPGMLLSGGTRCAVPTVKLPAVSGLRVRTEDASAGKSRPRCGRPSAGKEAEFES